MEEFKQTLVAQALPQAGTPQSAGEICEAHGPDTTPAGEITVPVKFNHVRKNLPLDQATVLAQKGLQAEAFLPKLQFLAALEQQSVVQLVDRLYSEEQEKTKQTFLQKVGDLELAEQLLQGRNQKVGKAYQALQEARAAEEKAKAEQDLQHQWQQLRQAVPQLESLPPQAQRIAEENGISLLDGYLRFCWQESRRIAAAEAQQALAAARSSGSQKSTASKGAELSAMLRGVWSR